MSCKRMATTTTSPMETCSTELSDLLSDVSKDELRGLLLVLEGRVVSTDTVRTSLSALRQPRVREDTQWTSSPPSAPAKRARHTEGDRESQGPGDVNESNKNTRDQRPLAPGGGTQDADNSENGLETAVSHVETSLSSPARNAIRDDVGTPTRTDSPGRPRREKAKPGTHPSASYPSVRGEAWKETQRLKAEKGGKGSKKKKNRKGNGADEKGFDHSRWRRRTVAIQLMYEGEHYAGFCSQNESNEETVEKSLFRALTTTKLVEEIATGENYSRCGRTDRGVSALGNVVTVSARSKFPKEADIELPGDPLGAVWIGEPDASIGKRDAPVDHVGGGARSAPLGNGDPGADQSRDRDATGEVPGINGGCAKEQQVSGDHCDPDGGVVCDSEAEAADSGGARGPVSSCLVAETERKLKVDGVPARGDGSIHGDGKGDGGLATKIVGGMSAKAIAPGNGGIRGAEDTDEGSGKASGKESRRKKPKGGLVREIDYCGMLNKVLPADIRALAWAPVSSDFSARFSCSDRTYRYFFLRRDLDVGAMDEAASRIVGEHDFRNLCKIDVANVSNFVRKVKYASVKPVPSPSPDYAGSEYYRVCVFEVCGQAFLWHMVRCLMAVLFMVGRGLETPEVMSFLLDLERCRAKPHYDMAPDRPLLLHECRFRSLQFQYTPEAVHSLLLTEIRRVLVARASLVLLGLQNLYGLQGHLEGLWEEVAIKAARLLNNLNYIAGMRIRKEDLHEFIAGRRGMKGVDAERYMLGGEGGSGGGQRQQEGSGQEAEEGSMTWREALEHLRTLGLGPGQVLGRKGHMRMVDRQQGLHYTELVEGLGGKKRERLERHLSLKKAGQESGATTAFYNTMQAQGMEGGGLVSPSESKSPPRSTGDEGT